MVRHRRSAGSCRPTIVTPSRDDLLAGLRQLAVAAGLGGEVDDHRAGAHRLDRRLPGSASAPAGRGSRAVVITTSKSAIRSSSSSCCCACCSGVSSRRVAALGLLADDAEVEEGRAEGLDLLPDGRAHVEAGDDRAEAARRRDRLQAGDAGADHEHLRRRDRSGGGRQHREEARQAVGGEQRRPCSRRRSPATRARPSAARA